MLRLSPCLARCSVFSMKNTLQAVENDAAGAKMRYQMSQGGKGKLDKETGENVRLRRTGPGLEKMRKAHRTLRNVWSAASSSRPRAGRLPAPPPSHSLPSPAPRQIILNQYPSMKACFKAIDADGSGLVRRNELRAFLSKLSKSIPDQVISGLIAYVDTDGAP